ncbi:CPBP family intramembrane glutamic endopeptidase [Natrononativus amylolyticus]|uniref:CPBP family intramembrane glutamic endopeptidase n=1 Tax=Natrononativus amylolyticus TaxID=2963434 RepID=UPI0020CE63BA|nr:type II CAAX endopeptidase family protein [Natrononativus amylolyticus]
MSETAGADESPLALETVPALGTVLATVAMVGVLVPIRRGADEPAVWAAAALALVAVGAFVVRRHGGLERRRGALIAAGASIGVVVLSGYAINQGVSGTVALSTVPDVSLVFLAFLAAGATASVAVADYGGVTGRGLLERGKLTLTLAILGAVGLLAAQIAAVMILVPVQLGVGEPSQSQLIVVMQFGVVIGTAVVAIGYLSLNDYGLSYLDLRWPTVSDALWTVGGIVVLFGALIGLSLLMESAGVESSSHGTTEIAAENPEILLVLIPASILVIGPFEELLYRNIIQKSLYRRFSRYGAVVVGSVIFAAVHLPAYDTGGGGEIMASLAIVFGLSIVLGIIYERTENLLVPSVVHGLFNAIQFASLYVYLT